MGWLLVLVMMLAGCDQLFGIIKISEPDARVARDAAPVCFEDSFSQGSVDGTKWSHFPNPPTIISVVGEALEIALEPSTVNVPKFAGVYSAPRNLTGTHAHAQLVEAPNVAGADEATIQLTVDTINTYSIGVSQGKLYFAQIAAGMRQYSDIAYVASEHRYLRLRHDAELTLIHHETSVDAEMWTTHRTLPAEVPLTRAYFEMYAGTWDVVAEPGRARFDNVLLSNPCP